METLTLLESLDERVRQMIEVHEASNDHLSDLLVGMGIENLAMFQEWTEVTLDILFQVHRQAVGFPRSLELRPYMETAFINGIFYGFQLAILREDECP